jgi:hypothetical protein
MADASVTYEVKGTSDVQEQTDKAKKSMGQMENAIEGLNKKMSSWGKDLILSYIAPMVLLNKAIDYIAQSIEKQRQATKDALEFTRKGESKELDPGMIYGARRMQTREQEVNDRAQAVEGRKAVTLDFLRNASSEDMDRLYKRLGPGSQLMYGAGRLVASREGFAGEASIQNAVADIYRANDMREQEERNKGKTGAGIDTMGVQNAVFGMGTSPIIASMDQQLDVQRQQADTLRRIEERLPPREEDYTKGDSGTPYRPTISFK